MGPVVLRLSRQWHARGGCCTELRGVSVAAGIHPRLARGMVGVTTSRFQGARRAPDAQPDLACVWVAH
jgi:hypothetical protein